MITMPGIDGPDFKLVKSALNQNAVSSLSPNFFNQPFDLISIPKQPPFPTIFASNQFPSKSSLKEFKSPKSLP